MSTQTNTTISKEVDAETSFLTTLKDKTVQLPLSQHHGSSYGRVNDPAPESIEMANKLLQKNHDDYHIFWRDLNGHNHMAHSILTHFAIGASPAELQRANDDGVGVQRARPDIDSDVVRGLSDDSKLMEIMGDLTQYSNAVEFFEQQIGLYGWRAILHKYCFTRTPVADTILARMYEGAHHPFIHLGLAVEFELPSMTAEALAQAVCHPFSGIPSCLLQTDAEAGDLNPNAPHKPLLDLYKEARVNEAILNGPRWEDGPFKMRDGTLGRSKTDIIRLAAQYRVKPSELQLRAAEVINCSAYIAGAAQRAGKTPKIDFFHMHNVTSSVFLTVLVNEPSISLENKVRLVEWKGRTDLFWYAACGCSQYNIAEIFNYTPGPSAGKGWTELYHDICQMKDDGHVAKFVRAAKSAGEVCRIFEQQDPAAFPMTGQAWIQLARMAYDSTLGVADPEKWVFGAGFPEAWENVPARSQSAAVKPKMFPCFTKEYRKSQYDAIDPCLPALSAAGKNIVITGGGSGIGAATALGFAQAGAASVSIIGRRGNMLESTRSNIESLVPGAHVYTYVSDVTDKDQMGAAFKAIHDHVGEMHVLINNAGYKPTVPPTSSAIKDLDVEEWWRCFQVNIKGSFLASQAFLRYKSDEAVVLYVTTALSHFTGFPNNSAYSSSKAGAVRVFSTLQAEHPEIRVICLHPGVVNVGGKVSGAKQAGLADDVSLSVGTMVWLASPEADFLKGKYIWANWDVTELKARAKEIAESDLFTMKLGGWPFDSKAT